MLGATAEKSETTSSRFFKSATMDSDMLGSSNKKLTDFFSDAPGSGTNKSANSS
jgi:hypothetical protein